MRKITVLFTILTLSTGLWANEAAPKKNLTVDDFEIELPRDNIYTGLVQEAVVKFKDSIMGAGQITVTYMLGNEEAEPINVGDYEIYVTVSEGDDYNAFPKTKIGKLPIWQASFVFDDFIFYPPENLEYDGNPKVATFVYDSKGGQRTGYGEITVKYNGSKLPPVEPGYYSVSIDIAEGLNYIALDHMTCDEWSFTITFSLDKYKDDVIAEIEAAGKGIQNEFINMWIDAAIRDINQPGTDTKEKVDNLMLRVLDLINAFQDGKAEGIIQGKTELLGAMATPCSNCTAVKVRKDETVVILYTPEEVQFIKTQAEE